ncbi:MAG: DUF2069 domain-containing protein [Burkholderiaceae bacterium]
MRAAPPLPIAVAWSRAIALACTLGLIVLGLLWELWLAPTGRGTLAIKVLPLAFAVSGLLKCRMPTYRWLSLLVWLYFAEGAVRAPTERGVPSVLAWLEIGLSLALFAACVGHIRTRLNGARTAAS